MLTRAQMTERWNYYSDDRVLSKMAGNTTDVIIDGRFNWGFLDGEYLDESIREGVNDSEWNKTYEYIVKLLNLTCENGELSDESEKKLEEFVYGSWKRLLLIWLKCEWEEFSSINLSNVETATDKDLDYPDYTLSSKWAICSICDGEGSHVNPSIDCNGITQSEWEEWDYEDREMYMSGGYDQSCESCNGSGKVRVYAEANEGSFLEWCYEKHSEACADRWSDALERAAEMRMGC